MDTDLFHEIINNAALLISLSILYDLVSTRRNLPKLVRQVIAGLVMGGIGIAVMVNPWRLEDGIVFDTRSILLSVGALFFGPLPAGLAAAITSVFRLYGGGTGAYTGIGVIATSTLVGIFWREARNRNLAETGIGELALLGFVVYLAMILWMVTLPSPGNYKVIARIWLPVMVLYPIGTILLGKLLAGQFARDEAAKALEHSEGQHRSLFENMLEGFAYCKMFIENDESQNFVYLDVNSAFERLTGLKDVIGKKVTEVIPGIRESNPELFEIYGRVAQTGSPEKIEIHVEPLKIWLSISVYSTEKEHFVAVFDNITERKRAETALREGEKRYREMYEKTPAMLQSIDRNARLVSISDYWLEVLGYDREDVLGRNPAEFQTPDSRRYALEHAIPNFLRTGISKNESLQFVKKTGEVVDVLLTATAERDEKGEIVRSRAVLADITARKKAEEVQKRLATAIEQSAEAILITDTEGTIQYVNPAMERITGFSGEELLGMTPRVFKSGEHDVAFYCHLWNTIKAGSIWSGRFVNKRKDGSLFHEEATISPVRNAAGKITNFVAVKRDITEHLQLSNQLFQAQKMEAVGTLAGGVAHDFNNLLQVVLGYSDLILSDEDFPERFKNDLEKVNQAARNGADLVGRLLMFSRKSEMSPLSINLNRRIEQLQKMLSRTLPKMIEIELVLAEDLSPVHADPTQVDQVLMNLAVNARDAMHEAGKLTIQTENLTLDKEYAKTHLEARPGHYVLLSVSDTGQGMDKETVQHIFEPFFTTKGPAEGTGLGLAMVYGVVKQHGGHVTCYSVPGQGTTFKIYLPIIAEETESHVTSSGEMPAFGTETVLLVDDESFVRELGQRILTRNGYTVLTADNGQEALAIYGREKERIDLVILDLNMPTMGGKDFLQKMIQTDPQAKILIASGYSANASTKECADLGAKGFVAKPFRVKELLRQVRKALDEE